MNLEQLKEKREKKYNDDVDTCVEKINDEMIKNIKGLEAGEVVKITDIFFYKDGRMWEPIEEMVTDILKNYVDDWGIDYYILPERTFVFRKKTEKKDE